MNTEGETRAARNKDSERGGRRRPWPAQVREAVVRSVMEQRLSTFAVAHKLGVPYTTAIQWVQAYRERGEEALKVRKPALHPNLKKPPDERAKAILATHQQAPHSGSRRIRDVMHRFLGIGTSETTVRRVLRAEGVKPQAAKRRVRRKAEVQHFERAEPNQLWQSDLFTFLLTSPSPTRLDEHRRRAGRNRERAALLLEFRGAYHGIVRQRLHRM